MEPQVRYADNVTSIQYKASDVFYDKKSKETVINQLLLVDLYNNTMMKTGKNNG